MPLLKVSGANLKDDKTHNTKSAKTFFDRIAQPRKFPSNLLSDFPKPIIGAINGYAIGVGCIVTFCCDLIVASEKSEWRLPQIALGVLPNYGGVIRLARFVGKGMAMRVGLGFPLTGEEAYRIGLAQWLVPHKEILQRAIEIAEEIAALPPLAARMVKESMNRGLDIPNLADASLVDSCRFMVLEMTEVRPRQRQQGFHRYMRHCRCRAGGLPVERRGKMDCALDARIHHAKCMKPDVPG